jgi:hypothetical protein
MQLIYREIEDFLSFAHLVDDEKRIALKGRLKHFQRAGWPRGTNLGKGSRVLYGIGQTLLLILSFEMLELGMRPEQIVQLLKFEGEALPRLFLRIIDDEAKSEPLLYVFQPDGLDGLRENAPDQQYSSARIACGASQLAGNLEPSAAMAEWKNFSVINLSKLFQDFASYFEKTKELTTNDFRESLEKWRAAEIKRSEQASTLNNLGEI